MKAIIEWLNNEPNQRIGIRVCQTAIGLAFVFRASTELQYADYLYSAEGMGAEIPYAPPIEYLFTFPFSTQLMLIALSVCGLFFIINFQTVLTTFLSLILFNIINNRSPAITDGGDNITTLVLIYMLFLIPYDKDFKPKSLRVWLHNLGVIAIGLQVMIMYFTAGFYKIMGEVWTGGIAMFNISQSDVFSLPIMYELFKNPYLATLSAYATMLFLIWFPIAMLSKIKLLWLGFGVLFHLGIIGFMGIVTFGVVMIGMELFFITDSEYSKIINQLRSFIKKVKYGKNRSKKELV